MQNVSTDCENDSKRRQHIESVRQWHRQHPNYQREYRQRQRQFAATLGVARNGTIPVKMQKKITYSVTVTRPLKPEERVQRDPPRKKYRRNHNTHATQFNHPSTHEDYEW